MERGVDLVVVTFEVGQILHSVLDLTSWLPFRLRKKKKTSSDRC